MDVGMLGQSRNDNRTTSIVGLDMILSFSYWISNFTCSITHDMTIDTFLFILGGEEFSLGIHYKTELIQDLSIKKNKN